MDNSMEIQDIRTRLEQFQANKDPRLKNTMSVPEMRRLLGLKKDGKLLARSQELF